METRRSIMRKKTEDDTTSNTLNIINKRVSFGGKKAVREFSVSEATGNYNASYEVSDHNSNSSVENHAASASASASAFASTIYTNECLPPSSKEQQKYLAKTLKECNELSEAATYFDITEGSSNDGISIESTVDITLFDKEIKIIKKKNQLLNELNAIPQTSSEKTTLLSVPMKMKNSLVKRQTVNQETGMHLSTVKENIPVKFTPMRQTICDSTGMDIELSAVECKKKQNVQKNDVIDIEMSKSTKAAARPDKNYETIIYNENNDLDISCNKTEIDDDEGPKIFQQLDAMDMSVTPERVDASKVKNQRKTILYYKENIESEMDLTMEPNKMYTESNEQHTSNKISKTTTPTTTKNIIASNSKTQLAKDNLKNKNLGISIKNIDENEKKEIGIDSLSLLSGPKWEEANLNLQQLNIVLFEDEIQSARKLPQTPIPKILSSLKQQKNAKQLFSNTKRKNAKCTLNFDEEIDEKTEDETLKSEIKSLHEPKKSIQMHKTQNVLDFEFLQKSSNNKNTKGSYRFSKANEDLLNDTSFLTKAKLGDETASRNGSKFSQSHQSDATHSNLNTDVDLLVDNKQLNVAVDSIIDKSKTFNTDQNFDEKNQNECNIVPAVRNFTTKLNQSSELMDTNTTQPFVVIESRSQKSKRHTILSSVSMELDMNLSNCAEKNFSELHKNLEETEMMICSPFKDDLTISNVSTKKSDGNLFKSLLYKSPLVLKQIQEQRKLSHEMDDSLNDVVSQIRVSMSNEKKVGLVNNDELLSPNFDLEQRERLYKKFEGTPHLSMIEFQDLEKELQTNNNVNEVFDSHLLMGVNSKCKKYTHSDMQMNESGLTPIENDEDSLQLNIKTPVTNSSMKRSNINLTPIHAVLKKEKKIVYKNDLNESTNNMQLEQQGQKTYINSKNKRRQTCLTVEPIITDNDLTLNAATQINETKSHTFYETNNSKRELKLPQMEKRQQKLKEELHQLPNENNMGFIEQKQIEQKIKAVKPIENIEKLEKLQMSINDTTESIIAITQLDKKQFKDMDYIIKNENKHKTFIGNISMDIELDIAKSPTENESKKVLNKFKKMMDESVMKLDVVSEQSVRIEAMQLNDVTESIIKTNVKNNIKNRFTKFENSFNFSNDDTLEENLQEAKNVENFVEKEQNRLSKYESTSMNITIPRSSNEYMNKESTQINMTEIAIRNQIDSSIESTPEKICDEIAILQFSKISDDITSESEKLSNKTLLIETEIPHNQAETEQLKVIEKVETVDVESEEDVENNRLFAPSFLDNTETAAFRKEFCISDCSSLLIDESINLVSCDDFSEQKQENAEKDEEEIKKKDEITSERNEIENVEVVELLEDNELLVDRTEVVVNDTLPHARACAAFSEKLTPICRKCRRCRESIGNNTNEDTTLQNSFVMPPLRTIPKSFERSKERLQKLKNELKMNDVCESYRRKSLERSFNLSDLLNDKNDDFSIFDETVEKKSSEFAENLNKKFDEFMNHIKEIEENGLKERKRLAEERAALQLRPVTFVERLQKLINEKLPNWIFNKMLQFSGRLEFYYEKIYTFKITINYEATDTFHGNIKVESVEFNDRTNRKIWLPVDYLLHFQLQLKLPINLMSWLKNNDENSILKMLQMFDAVAKETHRLCFFSWGCICGKGAMLEREECGKIVAIKNIRKLKRNENGRLWYVEKTVFRIDMTDLRNLCFEHIISPPLYKFREDIQQLPIGLNFLKVFLIDPMSYLKEIL